MKKILFSIPVAGIYYVLICSAVDALYESVPQSDKQQKIITLIFVISILTILSSYFLLTNGKMGSIRIGLGLGGSLLLFNSVVKNWDNLDSKTKVTIMALLFCFASWVAYYANKNDKPDDESEMFTDLDDDDDDDDDM